ncbi:MAG: ATP-binding cassette domain-containing protein [Dermatophilaceae bacterium]
MEPAVPPAVSTLAESDHRGVGSAAGHRGRVEVAGLTWRPYGRREPVLRDIGLTIAPGERVLLAGASGAGKSTLLRALAGLLGTVDAGVRAGSVTVDGADPGARPGTVGLVLQEPGAGVVAATVGRDVAFGPENVGMPRADMPPVVAAALAAVGLGDLPPDTPTSALSGGQTQRLALAGALALDPAVVLLDEPTAMLDPRCAQEVRDSVDRLDGHTLVVVEHLCAPWVGVVDRLVVLGRDGRVVADGPVAQVLDRERALLLDLGVWVPGVPPPDPVPVDLGVVGRRPPQAGSPERGSEMAPGGPAWAAALTAEPFTVDRTTHRLDGTTRTRQVAELAVSLDAGPGTLTALVGASGSGKSTVLHALAGFLGTEPADAVRAGGAAPEALAATDLARALAWVPQWSSATIIARTVLDEMLATSRALGDAGADTVDRARVVLAAVGLGHLEQSDPRTLSGGEQRRLAVASSLLHGPATLLADEPTVGQDRHTWAALAGLLDAYRAAGGAVVAATHDPHLAGRADAVRRMTPPPAPPAPESPSRAPLVARCGPLALLLGALLAVPAGVLSPHWSTSAWVLAAQVGLAAVGLSAPGAGAAPDARVRRVVVRLVPGLLAALSVGWSTWWLAGQQTDPAFTVAVRVLVIVLPSAVLLSWLDPDELGDHLAQRVGLPDRPVVATAAAVHRMQGFARDWADLGQVRRVRGLAASRRHPVRMARQLAVMTVGILVHTLRSAAGLAVAMDARGFATARQRTWARPARWRWSDSLLVGLSMLPVVVAVSVR